MKRIVLALVALMLAGPAVRAEVTLPSVFGDHMVLQRDKPVRVWGKAEPGEQVTVVCSPAQGNTVGDPFIDTLSAKADKNGQWAVKLTPHIAGGGSWLLKITGSKTNKPIEIKDVVFGEVWVASGQSNMAWTVSRSNNAKEEIAKSANNKIRMWTAQRTVKAEPAFDVNGSWQVASPETTGNFSAVAFYFARQVQEQLGVPVGILHSSWGGTPVEAWTSRGKLDQIDWAKPILERFDTAAASFDQRLAEYNQAVKKWQQLRNGPQNTGYNEGFAKPDFDDSKWKTMALPQNWEKAGLDKDGVVWFRKTIDLPDGWAGQPLKLGLGPIDDGDTTYFNNKQVGRTVPYNRGSWQRVRTYNVPKELVRQGKLTIAVRVVDLSGGGGIFGRPEQMNLSRADGEGEAISLAGDWKYHFAHEINNKNRPVAPPNARPFGPDHPHSPAGLFNGMIHPILPYTIRGAIWYQGESNASRAQQYRKLFPGLIEDWRKQFDQGEFPFLFVQLANYRAPSDKVEDTDWAHLRDAQLHTLRTVKNTGMAVTIDIGAANDIHPRNKQDVGKRLARWALADTYGKKDVVKSGPVYDPNDVLNLQIKGDQGKSGSMTLSFDSFGSTLKIRDDKQLRGFSIAGKDKVFHPASAEIIHTANTNEPVPFIQVWSDKVKDPVAVRYAWEDNPTEANLVNEEGLPASPFRTDDWEGPTDGRR